LVGQKKLIDGGVEVTVVESSFAFAIKVFSNIIQVFLGYEL
jgi:hypothetical protein